MSEPDSARADAAREPALSCPVDEAFTGRGWMFEAIGRWLADPDRPKFFLITGEPGSGKTALARRLEQNSLGRVPVPAMGDFGEGFLHAAHYCSARWALSTDARSFARSISLKLSRAEPRFSQALANSGDRGIHLVVQLSVGSVGSAGKVSGVVIENMDLSGLSPSQAFTAAVLEPLIALESDGLGPLPSLTVLVDGLDESLTVRETSIVDLLGGLEGASRVLRFIVTSRPESRILAELRDHTALSLSTGAGEGLSRGEVALYVRRRLEQDPALAGRVPDVDAAAKAISDKAAGNFLYPRLLLDDMAANRLSFEALDTLPTGLDGFYYDGMQRTVRRGGGQWASDYAPVIGPLSVAREPLSRAQLQQLTGRPASAVWACLNLFESFIEPVPSTAGIETASAGIPDWAYVLFHQSMRDFLRQERLRLGSTPIPNPFFLDLTQCHVEVADRYRLAATWDQVDWAATDEYGLRHLPHHLLGAGLTAQVPQLVGGSFLAAKVRRFHDYRTIRVDLMLGLQAAERAGDLPALLRMALVLAGLRVRAGTIDAARLAPLYALAGEVERAVDLAEIIQADWSRYVTLRSIVASLAPIDPDKAQWVAERADDPEARAESLVLVYKARLRRDRAIAAHRSLFDKVLTLVESSLWRYWQSNKLWDLSMELRPLAPLQAQELLRRALDRARQVDDPQHRYESLRRVAQSLADSGAQEAVGVYHEALNALEQMGLGEWRAEQYGETVGELASLDLDAAIHRSRRMDDAFCKVLGLARASIYVASRSRSEARALLTEAEDAVDLVGSGKAEASGWQRQAREAIRTADGLAEEVASGRFTPPSPRSQDSRLVLREPSRVPTLAESEYRRQIHDALSSDPGEPALSELVQRCVSAGDRSIALELVQAAIRRSARQRNPNWIDPARTVLIGEIATSDLPRALAQAHQGPGHSPAMEAIITRIATTDLGRAIALWEHSPPADYRNEAGALAGILCAAAEAGDLASFCRFLPPLSLLDCPELQGVPDVECTTPAQAIALLARWGAIRRGRVGHNLKCNTLAQASGLLARHAPELASAMLEWVLDESWRGPGVIGTALPGLIGTALARIGKVDPDRAVKLLGRTLDAYRAVTYRAVPQFEQVERLTGAARGAAEFAPEAALRALGALGPFEPGYRAGVYSAVARSFALVAPSRAADLRDRAIEDARRASVIWLQADAFLQIAGDCTGWDDSTALQLIDQAIDLARTPPTLRSRVLLGEDLADAASVLLLLGDDRRARSLLLEAADCLRMVTASSFELDAIVRVCQSGKHELAMIVTPRVVQAVTEQTSMGPRDCHMHEWLDRIMLLFLQAAGSDSVRMAERLLGEIEAAEQTADQIFLG